MVFATILCIRNVEEHVKETIHHSKLIRRTKKKRWDDIKEKICWALNLNMRYYTQISNNIKCSQARTHKYSTTQQMHQNRWTFFSFSFQTSSIVLIFEFFMTASWLPFIVTKFSKWKKKMLFFVFPHSFCVFNGIKWTFFTWIHS